MTNVKTKLQTIRLHAVLTAFALLVPGILATPVVLATDTADAPLAVFRPGAPGEPNWTMLKLGVDGPGRKLLMTIDMTNLRCPLAWGFILYEGEAPDATVSRSVTIDFSYGHNGARVRASGPAEIEYGEVEHDGAEKCNAGMPTLGIGFPDLPSGPLYLLQYKAGTPFEGFATLEAPEGGVRVVGESSGSRVVYLQSSDFGDSDLRAEFYGPQGCGGPNADPDTGFCDPDYRWPGGLLPGADVGTDRRGRVTFLDRPYFTFGAPTNLVGVSNATMRDPLGLIHSIYSRTGADAGSVAVNPGGIDYTTSGPALQHPAGEYVFNIRFNANVGQPAVPWHLSGADWHFPEEEADT